MFDSSYWNNLFQNRKTLIPYEKNIEAFLPFFKGSNLLDVGAGDGRNALFFSSLGYNVTCLDYSSIGLEKIAEKAKSNNTKIEIVCSDIEKDDIKLRDSFDVICFIHFCPSIAAIKKLDSFLNNNGIYFILSFLKEFENEDSVKYAVGIGRDKIEKMNTIMKSIEKIEFNDERGRQIGIIYQKIDRPTIAST